MNHHHSDPDRIAQSAVLAMLFELSSSPKPGNVDRCHDFPDIGFHHFLASAVSSYPVFREAARVKEFVEGSDGQAVGSLIRQAVAAWRLWGLESNTHFGSLTLMMPIALAAARPGDLHDEVRRVLAETTVSDAVEFYRAFRMAKARVADVESFSLNDDGWEEDLAGSKKTLLELMRLSHEHDLIAREWSTGFERTFILADRIAEQTQKWGVNDATVRVFLRALCEEPDSLICAKFGLEEARRVSKMAGEALLDETLNRAREIDAELLEKDINPGSTADLIAAALFISLLRGLRF